MCKRLTWKLLRISSSTYFVLGTDGRTHLRLRVGSSWDWNQLFELRSFKVAPRVAGQPKVSWTARARVSGNGGVARDVSGHVEIRWSHGRFVGAPEAKIYLDSPLREVPGYFALS